jgi:hypothetical protein
MSKWRATWSSLSERTGSGYVPLGTAKVRGKTVREYVEHDCAPPSNGSGSWTCGCGRVWRR